MKRSSASGPDRELHAIGAILSALEGLDGESIKRVLDYVFGRLSLNRSAAGLSPSLMPHNPTVAQTDSGAERRFKSIRDLREEKQPESSNQMAALVAYYLSELAPESDRKDEISGADIEKYFKQAGFKLPQSIRNTLTNAAASGYFDSSARGLYRLNPVGYNLVVHGLPRSEKGKPLRAKVRRRKPLKTKKAKPVAKAKAAGR